MSGGNFVYLTRERLIEIEKELQEKEVLIIYGARQVGKTTILKNLLQDKESILLNCEKFSVSEILESKNLVRIKQLFGENKIVVVCLWSTDKLEFCEITKL